MNFRRAIREASGKEKLLAKLGFRQRLKLRIIMFSPSMRRKLEEELLTKAIQHNAVPATTTLDAEIQEIDWEAIIDFIVEWLPVIIKLVITFL